MSLQELVVIVNNILKSKIFFIFLRLNRSRGIHLFESGEKNWHTKMEREIHAQVRKKNSGFYELTFNQKIIYLLSPKET